MSEILSMAALLNWHFNEAARSAQQAREARAKAAAYRSGSLLYVSAGGSAAAAIYHDGIAAKAAASEAFHQSAAALVHRAAKVEVA